tara:strand:- start:909 stop:1460 length:552 start_codon:yes stop_codon:yes gene_type:complete
MSADWPKAGVNHAPAYQVSGVPFVTSSVASEVKGVDKNSASPEPVSVEFPFVTKFVTIRNTGINELRVGFSSRGMFAPGERLPASIGGAAKDLKSGRNYFLIPTASFTTTTFGAAPQGAAGSIQKLEVRCKEIFFVSNNSDNSPGNAHATSFSLIAGLTTIDAGQFPVLTGSINSTGSFHGVG